MKKTLVVACLICLVTTPVLAGQKKVYDENYRLKYVIDGNRIYDKNYRFKGTIQGNRIYNEKYRFKGTIQKQKGHHKNRQIDEETGEYLN